MIYEEVFKTLNRHRVKYAVAGGIAVVLHGVVRFTADLDIIVDMTPQNIDRLFLALRGIDYLPRVPVTADQFKDKKIRRMWIKDKNMQVFSFFHRKSQQLIDVFVDERVNYKRMRKVKFKAGNLVVPAISLTELKKLKKKAGRPKDLIDLDLLKMVEKARNQGRDA